MAATILRSTFRLLLPLTVVVLAAVGSKNEDAPLEMVSGFSTTPRSKDNTKIVTVTRKDELGKPSTAMSEAKAKNEKVSWSEVGKDEAEDDKENDDEGDEYEEELRGIAESHEAMSKDERRNGISNSPLGTDSVSENRNVENRLEGTKNNFDSREKSTESVSDESSISNEATPEDDEDDEVAELLKYKEKGTRTLVKEEIVGGIVKPRLKIKRVPTVKKELGTQKEIIASNETQIFPKTLVSNVEIVNRLDDETKPEREYSIPIMGRGANRYELVRDDMSLEDEYPDVDTSGNLLRKLDKRQPTELNGPGSYYLGNYVSEQEQQRKLQELGIEEGILAENLMELLTRLAEDPRRWERVHRLLQDVEGSLELSRSSLPDSKKRAYSQDSLLNIPITESSTYSPERSTTSKKPKKKKKKKKPRHRFSSTTSTTSSTTMSTTPTPVPFTPLLLTTTESPWPTTPAQWRLVAERLFGSPWSDDNQEVPSSSLAKVRYASTTNQRGSSGSTNQDRLLPIDEKQLESLKALNDERQALMLQSAREYSQPRRLHYGKVNTHEKGSSDSSHEDSPKTYDTGTAARVLDYDLPERNYQRSMGLDRYDRYGQYNRQRSGDYGINPPVNQQQRDDYDEIFRFPEGMTNRRPFARTQPFRPLGREYASMKSWQDSRYDYSRPWKDKSHTSFDGIPGSRGNWPWRNSQSNYKIWVPRYRPWSHERLDLPRRMSDADEEFDDNEEYVDNDSPTPQNWQRNSQRQRWRSLSGNSGWPLDRNDVDPSWRMSERPKSYSREILPGNLEKSKNLSELSSKETNVKSVIKEKPMLPKITMKTWNSLTSDPATWPFKLNGAKPWPKDKNGNSYNPNAELVRKLGLDKQDRLLSSNKDSDKDLDKELTKYKIGKGLGTITSGQEEKVSNLEKNSMSWPDKLSAVNEWSNDKSREIEGLPQRDEASHVWHSNVENERNIWSGESPISSKISSVGSWVMPADQSTWKPYEIKHQAYGQLSESPRGRWPDRTKPEDTGTGSWSSQKISNDWNTGVSGYSGEKSLPSTAHSSTWPSKWRQFTYHKVTAPPVTKLGSSNSSEASGRTRNSYIAVSDVSASKYPSNEWRKNDVEETQFDRNSNSRGGNYDQDDPSSQLRKNDDLTKEVWNQQRGITGNKMGKDLEINGNDPLEHQLEELRRMPYWNNEQLRDRNKKRSNPSDVSTAIAASTQLPQTSLLRTNSTMIESKKSEKKLEENSVVDAQVQQMKNITK